jgi:hypothetical protein
MPAAGRRIAPAPHLDGPLPGPSVAVRGKPDGVPDRATGTDAVRYTSVDTATHRPAVTHPDTGRDKKETARLAENFQLAGRFRRWWQVLGSNQRRLSRRFYRPLAMSARSERHRPGTATHHQPIRPGNPQIGRAWSPWRSGPLEAPGCARLPSMIRTASILRDESGTAWSPPGSAPIQHAVRKRPGLSGNNGHSAKTPEPSGPAGNAGPDGHHAASLTPLTCANVNKDTT